MKKHIKAVAGVLAIAIAFSGGVAVGRENISITAPITANAYETYGALTYAIEYDEVIIKGFDKSTKTVVIPSEIEGLPVTSIGDSSFYECSGITSVTIPDSVKIIGNNAFYGCKGLTSVEIPDSVTSIGSYAFYMCSYLKSVTIPDSVRSISDYAFSYSGLTSVTIPDSVISIGDYAFSSSDLTSITIPGRMTSIGNYVFWCCHSLTSVTIPDSVTSIGDYAFSSSGLTSITIPESVTSIDRSAFYGCDSITSIVFMNPFFFKIVGNSTYTNTSIGNRNTTVYGYKDSSAQAYATYCRLAFSALDAVSTTTTLTSTTTMTTSTTTTITTTTATTPVTEIKEGDINKDGRIDAVDASIILGYYAYLSTTQDSSVMTISEFLSVWQE